MASVFVLIFVQAQSDGKVSWHFALCLFESLSSRVKP